MTEIYCGNNSQDADLLSGVKTIGTRYRCLKKGVGVGMNQPIDPKYGGAYDPIDDRRMYCGNKPDLPDGYDLMGTLPWCLQKGVGIGKRSHDGGEGNSPSLSPFSKPVVHKNLHGCFYIVLLFSISLVLLVIMCVFKLMIRKKKNRKTIRWKRFAFVYSVSVVILGLTLFLIYKHASSNN